MTLQDLLRGSGAEVQMRFQELRGSSMQQVCWSKQEGFLEEVTLDPIRKAEWKEARCAQEGGCIQAEAAGWLLFSERLWFVCLPGMRRPPASL